MTSPPLLEIAGVAKAYSNQIALAGVNLKVKRGEVICVVGPSGCGKSTLLRCINWLQPPDTGEIILDGQLLGSANNERSRTYVAPDIHRQRAKIGMVFQQFNIWPHFTVLENIVRAQTVVLGRARSIAEQTALKKLNEVGMAEFAQRNAATLSGGQKQRVAIVRALAMDPLLMLMDEPTSALDPEAVSGILEVMLKLASKGMTMILVTHELGFAARVADRLVFMDKGAIVEQGPPTELLHSPGTKRLKTFLHKLEHLNPFHAYQEQTGH